MNNNSNNNDPVNVPNVNCNKLLSKEWAEIEIEC